MTNKTESQEEAEVRAEFLRLITDTKHVVFEPVLPEELLDGPEPEEPTQETPMANPKVVRLLMCALEWSYTGGSVLKQMKMCVINHLIVDCHLVFGENNLPSFYDEDDIRCIELQFCKDRFFSSVKNIKYMKFYFDICFEVVRITIIENSGSKGKTRVEICDLSYSDFPPTNVEKCETITNQLQKAFEIFEVGNDAYMRVPPVTEPRNAFVRGGASALHLQLSTVGVQNISKLKQAKMALINYLLKRGHRIVTDSISAFYDDDAADNVFVDLQASNDSCAQRLNISFSTKSWPDGILIRISGISLHGPDARRHLRRFVIRHEDLPLDSALKCDLIIGQLEKSFDVFLRKVLKNCNTTDAIHSSRLTMKKERRTFAKVSLVSHRAPQMPPIVID